MVTNTNKTNPILSQNMDDDLHIQVRYCNYAGGYNSTHCQHLVMCDTQCFVASSVYSRAAHNSPMPYAGIGTCLAQHLLRYVETQQ